MPEDDLRRRRVDSADDVARLAHMARSLLGTGGGLESVGGHERLSREELVPALTEHLRGAAASSGPGDSQNTAAAVAEAAAESALNTAEAALERLASGTPPGNLSDDEVSNLEAIVLVSGRPAMGFVGGKVQMPPNVGANSPWRVLVVTFGSSINEVSASVGRIDLNPPGDSPIPVGTGWRVGADLVITNRHVARAVMVDPAAPVDRWPERSVKPATITFGTAAGPLALSAPVYVAPDDPIDFAVFRLRTTTPIPAPLAIEWDEVAVGRMVPRGGGMVFIGNPLYAIGHPWRAFSSSAVASVFGVANGAIRWSPGYATRLDVTTPVLEHDCSTLGGSSGSCVLSADGHAVVALHVGGLDVAELSGMGAANLALPLAGLLDRREGAILRTGKV